MSIRSFSNFLITEAAEKTLNEKAEKYDVSVEVLLEVFNRGVDAWVEDCGKTCEQYAFNRVNSFLSGGMASKLDKDLLDENLKIKSNVEFRVVHPRDTKKVIKRYTQKHKAMYHAKKSTLHVHTTVSDRVIARHDHLGRRLDARGYIIHESAKYIEARQKIHNAHAEVSRQLAGRERDPELRRIDLHRSKKHEHASRVLDIIKSTISKKNKK